MHSQQHFPCHICNKDLSHLTVIRRQIHINRCLNDCEKQTELGKKVEDWESTVDCPLCQKPLPASGPFRSNHIKGCAKVRQIATADLIRLEKAQGELAATRRAQNLPHTRAPKPSKESMPSDTASEEFPTSDLEEKTHLATMLSRSISCTGYDANDNTDARGTLASKQGNLCQNFLQVAEIVEKQLGTFLVGSSSCAPVFLPTVRLKPSEHANEKKWWDSDRTLWNGGVETKSAQEVSAEPGADGDSMETLPLDVAFASDPSTPTPIMKRDTAEWSGAEPFTSTPLPPNVQIIKETNVTPYPEYSKMQTPQLKEACMRFGIRKTLSRKRTLPILKRAFEVTHPAIKVRVLCERRTALQKDILEESFLSDVETNQDGGDVSEEQLREIISKDEQLYTKILTYQPISFEQVLQMVMERGFKISQNRLADFLDGEGVTWQFTAKPKQRHRLPKKRRKKVLNRKEQEAAGKK